MADKKIQSRGPWQIRASQQVYENDWVAVTHHEVLNPNGGEGVYGTVHFRNLAVGILPVDDENCTWLVEQYRFPLRETTLEIPEGGSPEGESPLETAKRELKEEAGLSAASYQKILEMDLSNSVTDERAVIFLASGIERGIAEPDETEQLKLRRVPLKEALDMVGSGKIRDAISVAALLRLAVLEPGLFE